MQIIAIAACVLAALLGAMSVVMHSGSLGSVVNHVTHVWMLAWVILVKAYTRGYWTALNRPIKDLIQKPLPATVAPTPVSKAVAWGMMTLIAFDTYLSWFG